MKFLDYLLMRTPEMPVERLRMGEAAKGQISGRRIVLSILGILAGIGLSFVVAGLEPRPASGGPSGPGESTVTTASPPGLEAGGKGFQPHVNLRFSWNRLLTVGIISLVICGLTYQNLYFSLRLYNNEPAWLVLFVSFQYGYFWQSAVEGARIVLAGTGTGTSP